MTSPSSDYRTIPLTQGQVALVSAHRFEELNKFKWYASWSSITESFYAVRNVTLKNGKRCQMRMHRFILGLYFGDGRDGEHRNCDTLDNRDENLRIATRSQNRCNTMPRSDNSSGFKGVYWNKWHEKWTAKISLNGKGKNLGYFSTPEEAHAAYCSAAREMHGEFARTK